MKYFLNLTANNKYFTDTLLVTAITKEQNVHFPNFSLTIVIVSTFSRPYFSFSIFSAFAGECQSDKVIYSAIITPSQK